MIRAAQGNGETASIRRALGEGQMERDLPGRVDVVVVGSGAAALTGAVTAAHAGLDVIIVEKAECWGGTSAYSGGGVWIPNNPVMARGGVEDSEEAALTYIDACVGDIGPFTTVARKQAFVRQGPKMVELLDELGMGWTTSAMPDYFPQLPGFRRGRSLGTEMFDGSVLGPLAETIRAPVNYPAIAFHGAEMGSLFMPFRTAGMFRGLLRILGRTLAWRAAGKVPLTAGQATTGRLMLMAQRLGAPLFLETAMTGLEVEDARVKAIEVTRHGVKQRIEVARGVLIAAGGFARNEEYRRRFQALGEAYSTTHEGDTGEPIQIAEAAGAAIALMDEAWWMPVVVMPSGRRCITLWERAMPHSIIVDQTGQRFMNEAQPYVNAGRLILERNATAPSIPSWVIIDDRHRRNYAFGMVPAGYTPRSLIKAGFFVKAASLEALAGKIGIDPAALAATVERFNRFARTGEDEDFGRGGNAFDNGYGDPWTSPNPNLGTIEEAPFYAVRIYPGDLGTKGGLVTDEHGRVVDKEGRPIEGLYASGNSTASVFGRSYPGGGGTLGPGMVFAYLAMLHAASV
jgi:3-oxosteroid 1-dehydrogenase